METISNAKLFFPVNLSSQFYKDVLELGELAKLGKKLVSHIYYTCQALIQKICMEGG